MKYSQISFLILCYGSLHLVHAQTKLTPEKEAARLGKLLKPISDQEWQQIAGTKFLEKYSISRGDTLFGISKKLFGNSKVWPKIYAINNDQITNPHSLKPGTMIAFSLNSASSTDTTSGILKQPGSPTTRSTEWQGLFDQSWEYNAEKSPFPVDALGFDLRPIPSPQQRSSMNAVTFAVSEELPGIAKILGSPSHARYLSGGDLVHIESFGEGLQKNQTYAVIDAPHALKSNKSDRLAYAYSVIGRVKILTLKDHSIVGRLISSHDTIPRGSLLIPLPERIPTLIPTAGPRPLSGTFLFNRSTSVGFSAQHQFGFVDRGSEEGIRPGMVFRAYHHRDPVTDTQTIHANITIDADFIVTQVSATMCTVRVLHSNNVITHDTPVILLTDLADLNKNDGFSETGALQEDDLDQLDHGDGLNSSEKRELKQLEKWNENPNNAPAAIQTGTGSELPPASAPDAPSDGLLDTPVTPPSEISPSSSLPPPVTPALDNLPPPQDLLGDPSGAPLPIAPDTASSPDSVGPDGSLPPIPEN